MQDKGLPMSNPRGLRVPSETEKHASRQRLTRSVRGGISAFMIAMNGDVQPKVFRQVLVRAITHKCSIISDKVQILADGRRGSAVPIHVSVNASCESWEARHERKAVFQSVRPIIGLLYPCLICPLEHAVVVECRDANAELCHRMQ
jgi:hypothetical protein